MPWSHEVQFGEQSRHAPDQLWRPILILYAKVENSELCFQISKKRLALFLNISFLSDSDMLANWTAFFSVARLGGRV